MNVHPERAHPVAAALRPWVADVRTMTFLPEPARTVTRLPSAATTLVVCTAHARGVDLIAAGPNTRASYKASRRVPLYARFTFRPGAARAFFGVALHALADRVVSLDALWGAHARRLRDQLAEVEGSPQRAVAALEGALLARLAPSPGQTSRVVLLDRAARALEGAGVEVTRVPEIAAQLGVGERQLRQLFHEEIGISPKRYARIARLRHVLAHAGRHGWAQLATDAGYYDQAHLNADFREMLGVTPRAYLARNFPLDDVCPSP
jgi:AraC-like DNA-binding protein